MEIPYDIDAFLKGLLRAPKTTVDKTSVLSGEDEAYLRSLIAAIRSGKRAVLIVEDVDERLRYMFSNAFPAEAISMLGKVTQVTGRRMSEENL